jgi:two-component system chemotaxis response regulator CheB
MVIGGSAGAFAVLKVLLPALPRDTRLPVIIVLHLPPDRPSVMASVFARDCRLTVKEAEDKEPLAAGTVYFAPPSYHLLVESNQALALSSDELVHHSRPSVDVLFESAADVFGRRLLALVLSGANQDGAAGLKKIGLAGGTAIVQAPPSAEQAAMPAAALDAWPTSAALPLDELVTLFASLGTERATPGPLHG